MEKTKVFKNAFYSAEIIKNVLSENIKSNITKSSFRLRRDDESWEFDDELEFYADYRKPHESSTIRKLHWRALVARD